MNYNPFLYQLPAKSGGLLSSLFGGMNFSTIISNASKTLGVINQAIPIVKQVRPVVKNAKTMFKVMNEFKKTDSPKINNNKNTIENTKIENTKQIANIENNNISFDGSPVFFA